MARRKPQHPFWCGRGHVCSATSRDVGQHRSHPLTYETGNAEVIVTRARSARRDVLEVRLVLDLPAGDEMTQMAVAGMWMARIERVVSTPLPAIRRRRDDGDHR